MIGNEYISLYELQQYYQAFLDYDSLVKGKEAFFESLYDDISPTMTSVDYDTGLCSVISTYPDSMAIRIIEEKERYNSMINREERKAFLFEQALDSLTDRELQVAQVYYRGRKNDLGLSPEYFTEILLSVQDKLCGFLEKGKKQQIKQRKAEERMLGDEAVQNNP